MKVKMALPWRKGKEGYHKYVRNTVMSTNYVVAAIMPDGGWLTVASEVVVARRLIWNNDYKKARKKADQAAKKVGWYLL